MRNILILVMGYTKNAVVICNLLLTVRYPKYSISALHSKLDCELNVTEQTEVLFGKSSKYLLQQHYNITLVVNSKESLCPALSLVSHFFFLIIVSSLPPTCFQIFPFRMKFIYTTSIQERNLIILTKPHRAIL